MDNPRIPFFLFIILILTFTLSLLIGHLPLSLLYKDPSLGWMVIETLRLPRTLLSFLTGTMLGFTGAILQGYLRNPLADVGIIGVSSAASFSAVIALALGFSPFLTSLYGITGAFLVMFFLYGLTLKKSDPVTLIVTGLSLNSLFTALTSLTLNLSKNPYKNLEVIFWLLGSFSHQSLDTILVIIPFLLIGTGILWRYRPLLDALTLGEDTAITLGYSLRRSMQIIIIGTSLCIGPLVALGGTIGFVGLIIPHILRYFIQDKPSSLLLPSALGGGILCLLADIAVRILPTQTEIKIGVITALLGAPFFLFLILKKNRGPHDFF